MEPLRGTREDRIQELAEAMQQVWMLGLAFKPAGAIDWLRFAEAVDTALTSGDVDV